MIPERVAKGECGERAWVIAPGSSVGSGHPFALSLSKGPPDTGEH